MTVKNFISIECKVYQNTGSYGSPTWVERKNVKDVQVPKSKVKFDNSSRIGRTATSIGTLRNIPVTLSMLYDTGDLLWQALNAAYWGDGVIEFAFVDGDITVAGTQGLRGSFGVFDFGDTQNLTEGVLVNVGLEPARTDNEPAWMVISA